MSTITTQKLRDQLGGGNVTSVSTAAMSMIDALQRHEGMRPGESAGAIIALFILTLEASGLPMADALGITRNLMADAEGRRAEFKAIAEYLEEEVLPA